MVDFGVRLPVAGPLASVDGINAAALAAADLGFSTLWVHDFLVWTRALDRAHVSCGSAEVVEARDSPPYFHESLTNLAYLAALTRQTSIKLGVAVLVVPYRNPVVAARQVANIDVLSEGRLILGVGVGAPADTGNREFEVMGISRSQRYERTREYVQAMKAIWADPITSFDGKFVAIPPTEFYPKPVQQPCPPIWLGGFGPKTRAMVAEFGVGWLPGITLTPADFAAPIQEIRHLAEQRGRGDFTLTVGLEATGVSIAATDTKARRSAQATLESMVRGYGGGAHGTITMDRVLAYALVGSPATLTDKIGRYVEAGVMHFELKPVYHSIDHLMEQMDMFAREVMPAFS